VPKIDLELGKKAGEALKIPMVLHGGSGTPHEKVKALIRSGFAKVNVATEFQHAYQMSLQGELEKLGGKFLPADKLMMKPTEDAAKLLRDFIKMFSNPQ
jgi:fructose/tagatose bisphosphate aldolase